MNVKDYVNLECCLKVKYLDLEDRRKLLLAGSSWNKIKDGNIHQVKRLKKEELEDELERRGIDIFNINIKDSLQEELSEVLHGICRNPALS